MTSKVDFYHHSLGPLHAEAMAGVLGGRFLTMGPKCREFEGLFAEFLGCRFVRTVQSGTTGLFLAVKACGIGAGDEVIVPAMTFIATANVVLHAGADVTFCDCDPHTGNIAIDQIERLITPRTRAIMPVHLYGQMVDMAAILAIANRHGLKVIEDSAHCVEGTRDGTRPGQSSDAAVFSFYATKNITCGEGGAIATNDPELAAQIDLLRSHGMNRIAMDRFESYQHWDMVALGYKANLTDLQAALLIPQLAEIAPQLQRRNAIARYYEDRFTQAGIGFPIVEPGVISARHLFTIWVPPQHRDTILSTLQARGIGVTVNYRAVHCLKFYRSYLGERCPRLPHAERIGDTTISLPLYPGLTDEEIDLVVDTVIDIVRSLAYHGS